MMQAILHFKFSDNSTLEEMHKTLGFKYMNVLHSQFLRLTTQLSGITSQSMCLLLPAFLIVFFQGGTHQDKSTLD